MLASLSPGTDAPLDDPHLVYEPKYDGIRAIVEITPKAAQPVRLWSRLGNDKTGQFPELTAALADWSRRLRAPVVLDGEVVALDKKGEPAGFQRLQRVGGGPVAFIAFDLLKEGRTDWRDRPLVDRRAALERIFPPKAARGGARAHALRISEFARGHGQGLYERALASGWEGLVAKRAQSLYASGKRSPDWRKIKIVHEQEFVVGGWTEPQGTRSYLGALLLGVYRDSRQSAVGSRQSRATSSDLVYAGHVGTGFDERELARLMKQLKPLETEVCPFVERPATNERAHWVRPTLVAGIKFTEWTADGMLRHPVYLGLRDDKKPRDVVREPEQRLHTANVRLKPDATPDSTPDSTDAGSTDAGSTDVASGFSRTLIDQLDAIETTRRDGVLLLPGGDRLNVTNLHKVFWPGQKLTKGDLLRYYVQVAPCILPVVADRPLVMKRYPNGIGSQAFYQHQVQHAPDGVRVETPKAGSVVPQFIGGGLKTLLWVTQLAAISQDPWFSRVQSIEYADHVALDLDPAPGVPFVRVLDVARWIHDELDARGAMGAPKTSGADGLHIYVPLPPDTPYEAGRLFCQIIATIVAEKHPKVATIERSVRARGPRVYIDYLQNILGKTLAAAYSARASDYAGASTPLSWAEVERGVKREDFTIRTLPARIKKLGDLWAALRKAKGVDWSRL